MEIEDHFPQVKRLGRETV